MIKQEISFEESMQDLKEIKEFILKVKKEKAEGDFKLNK